MPQLVVITPVRNEAWVLEAFLTHCSSWADFIIVADQHSSDGSREIALRFPKVTLIDNPTDEWIEWKVRASLLEEAQKIEGDKIIFALDADEFLSEDFQNTAGWKKIIESTPNEIFCFRWFNLYGDLQHGEVSGSGAEWGAHFSTQTDMVKEYLTREKNAVHCQRVPCLDGKQCKYTLIEDIRFIHLGNLNRNRLRNKLDFYQIVNIDKNPKKSHWLNLYRSYSDTLSHSAPLIDSSLEKELINSTIYQFSNTFTQDHGGHYIAEIVAIIQREGYHKFRWLCIWDNPDLKMAGINYQPPILIRLFHAYAKFTQPIASRSRLVQFCDKLIKKTVGN